MNDILSGIRFAIQGFLNDIRNIPHTELVVYSTQLEDGFPDRPEEKIVGISPLVIESLASLLLSSQYNLTFLPSFFATVEAMTIHMTKAERITLWKDLRAVYIRYAVISDRYLNNPYTMKVIETFDEILGA